MSMAMSTSRSRVVAWGGGPACAVEDRSIDELGRSARSGDKASSCLVVASSRGALRCVALGRVGLTAAAFGQRCKKIKSEDGRLKGFTYGSQAECASRQQLQAR